MPEPPRRKRFQIHLSTALVMMFVAGALIWVNVSQPYFSGFNSGPGLYINEGYGWPFLALLHSIDVGDSAVPDVIPPPYQWKVIGIVGNLAAAIVILLNVRYICEWLIRRRAARNGA